MNVALPLLLTLVTLSLLPQAAPTDWRNAPAADWQAIFNGRNLDGWVVKFAHHELGDNYADTFRVDDGVIRVAYDKYGDFGERFGHLFYDKKLSHYVLALEYRFVGEQVKGGPGYARLNSGVMVHSQAPATILKDQDWPISVEAQFLVNFYGHDAVLRQYLTLAPSTAVRAWLTSRAEATPTSLLRRVRL